MPVGKVIGEFTIEEIHSDCPERLWDKTKEFSGITEGFFTTAAGRESGGTP